MSEAKLTEKQRRFVEAYMGAAAGNATEAARIAGYKGNAKTLGVVGSENLAKPCIQEAIEVRTKSDPAIATREARQRFWTEVMLGRGEHGSEFVEMRDRLKASELLGRSQADFVEKIEHSGANGGPIETASADLRQLSVDELRAYRMLTAKVATKV